MAVQPDPRPLEVQAAERGMDFVIVAHNGPYALCRFRYDLKPVHLYIRDTRPGHRIRESVSWEHHRQWVASTVDGVRLEHYATAVEAFEAWCSAVYGR